MARSTRRRLAALGLIGVAAAGCAGLARPPSVSSCGFPYRATAGSQRFGVGSCAGTFDKPPQTVTIRTGQTLSFVSLRDADGVSLYPVPTILSGHALRPDGTNRFAAVAAGTTVLEVHSMYCNDPSSECPALDVTVD